MALDTEPAGDVTVTIEDATGTDLTLDPASLTFTKQNWIAPQTVTVTAGQDHDVFDDEAILTHTVRSPDDGIYHRLGVGDVTVTVTDNDRPPVTVSFESATYSPTEGDSFAVTVILSGDPERTVVVPLTRTERGGASGDDYSGVPANVTFNAGETEKSFTFTAIPDEVNDDGKSVELGFGSPSADGVSAGNIVEAIVSITDDDVPSPVTVNFGASTYSVLERGAVQVVLTLDDDPERTVVIPLSRTNQGGASDADYRGVPTSVTFNAGETEKSFTFTAIPDEVNDDGKSVELGFGSPSADGVSAGNIVEAIVSITDDDVPSPVTVNFGASTYSVLERGAVQVVLTLDDDPERTVVIPLSRTNQGGASDADYRGVPTSVTFNAGESEKVLTFTATHDRVDDDGESVKLGVRQPSGGGSDRREHRGDHRLHQGRRPCGHYGDSQGQQWQLFV